MLKPPALTDPHWQFNPYDPLTFRSIVKRYTVRVCGLHFGTVLVLFLPPGLVYSNEVNSILLHGLWLLVCASSISTH